MIAEYGIIPDILDPLRYSNAEVCDLRLTMLKERLLGHGIIRDFRDGEWSIGINNQRDKWHQRGKELFKKLGTQGRLRRSQAILPECPVDADGWCREALASHAHSPLCGIISDDSTALAYSDSSIVAAISKINQAAWWQDSGCSIELARTSEAYLKALSPVLRHSNSVMFIDPHLDPREQRYGDFKLLLKACGDNDLKPLVEIHRVCYIGSGEKRQFPDWRQVFSDAFRSAVDDSGLSIEIFIWDDFHDRFLISNLIGLVLPNGFDTNTGRSAITRWARLDGKHRDSVQREFDAASNQHKLQCRFKL